MKFFKNMVLIMKQSYSQFCSEIIDCSKISQSRRRSFRNSRQQGAVLIVSMVILLVMTVLGVSSRVSSDLQQKMSTAYQQRSIAGYAAEAALRSAELWLSQNVLRTQDLAQFQNGALGLYSNYAFNAGGIYSPSPAVVQLDDTSLYSKWTVNNSVGVVTYDPAVANVPRYIIEYIGRGMVEGDYGNKIIKDYNITSNQDNSPHTFLITAIGWGRDGGIYQVLESSYQTGQGPVSFVP